ncbi:O-methyltransferase [Streptomyces zhaozhouensis]|uniref:O-methyltransferase n=1 Tax=Streptomyces zhaozhouensis TaxID=1300267 RepID=A0A286E3X8_9ACTN|nr:acetylserotonin O-methyltransferase [Streptomyces zhaozhouensis]SOD65593.1 O-methyltransferase [Streptomyces zhaozhouensis]
MSDQIATETEQINPGQIMGILTGYWQARILLAGASFDLFTSLSEAPATAEEVSERLGIRMPGAGDFLLALSAMGILEASEDGTFRNSAVAEGFLVRGRPAYIGGYLHFCESELNPAWDGLPAALRTGAPQNPAARTGNPYDTLYADREATTAFLESMDMLNTPLLERLSALDWSRYGSFVDVAGARGNVARHLVREHRHLKGGVFDLPPLEGAFTAYMGSLDGEEGRASPFTAGTSSRTPFPRPTS